MLSTLRETARLYSTHYSTRIEGNRLTQEQVAKVIERQEHFPGRERDEKEVLAYYAALEKVERIAASQRPVSEVHVQTLHRPLRHPEGRKRARPTPYRDGQNVIRDSRTRGIVYMPPEAKDVPSLMKALVAWISRSQRDSLPCPIRAGIAHYQFATVHPYYDGNGRAARLLTTLILHLGARRKDSATTQIPLNFLPAAGGAASTAGPLVHNRTRDALLGITVIGSRHKNGGSWATRSYRLPSGGKYRSPTAPSPLLPSASLFGSAPSLRLCKLRQPAFPRFHKCCRSCTNGELHPWHSDRPI